MERKEAIRGAYRMTGENIFYAGMITCSTLRGKAVCRLVWDMNKAENDDYLEKALSGIPEQFSGRLPEVPMRLYHLRRSGPVCKQHPPNIGMKPDSGEISNNSR